MKAKKALKIIEQNLEVAIHDSDGDNPKYEQEQISALKLAVEALEMQIPKKPYLDNDNGIYETEHCPLCNRKLFPDEHHCKCGQAIDWSVRE